MASLATGTQTLVFKCEVWIQEQQKATVVKNTSQDTEEMSGSENRKDTY